MPWFWDLVAMSSHIPLSLPNLSSLFTAIRSDPSQKSDKSYSPCRAPRASAIEEQDLSEAVAARIEAPQRGGQSDQSMRQMGHFYQVMYHSSGGLRAPPVKSVVYFLRYLFQDRKLQPSTIDGYRSAIADGLEICPSFLVRMKISLVSWIASTETDPKAGG